MSTITDTVYSAIDDGARDRRALIDATGFEATQISNALSTLRLAGKIEKRPDGWFVMGSAADPKRAVAIKPNSGINEGVSRSSTSKPPAEPPALRGEAQREGEPIPAKDAVPTAARAGLTWAIDHRGKLIICLGDAAYELQPPQWAPLARFLEPVAGVFA